MRSRKAVLPVALACALFLAVAVSCTGEDEVEKRLAEAESLIRSALSDGNPQRYRQAEELYKKALALWPYSAEAHYGLGQVYLAQKRFPKARDFALRAVKLTQAQNDVFAVQRARNGLGKIYLAEGNKELAAQLFKESVLRRSRFRYHRSEAAHWGCAYQGLGELYSKLGSSAVAETIFADLKNLGAEEAFLAALKQVDAGDHVGAWKYLNHAISLDQQSRYEVLQGFLLLFQKEYDKAERLFGKHDEDPGSQAGLGHLGIVHRDYAEAKRRLEASLEGLSQGGNTTQSRVEYRGWVHKMAGLGMGWVLANQNKHRQAIEYFDRALSSHPDDILCLLGKANSLIGLRRMDEAEAVLSRVLEIDPGNPYALAESAIVKLSRGEDARAEKIFEAALARDLRNYTCPYEGLGLVYLKQGRIAQAKKSFQRAIEINPDIEYKKFNGLARIHIREKNYDEAERLLMKSIENFPYDNEAAELLRLVGRLRDGRVEASLMPSLQKPTDEFTMVSLAPFVPVNLLMSIEEAENFEYSLHGIELKRRVVYQGGEAIGLDLAGAGVLEAARLVKEHPQAAASIRLDSPLHCTGELIAALREAGVERLALTISNAAPSPSDWRRLNDLKIQELYLEVHQADDPTLAAIAHLPVLRELRLEDTKITDAGLAYLSPLIHLRVLILAHTNITDAGLAHLSVLTKLRVLNIAGTKVRGAGLKAFSGLTALRELELEDTKLTDAGLENIAGLIGLRRLGLGGTAVSDEGLSHLSGLTGLRYLALWGTKVGDAGLSFLSGLTGLKELELFYTRITDAGLVHLAALSELEVLDIGGTGVGDAGMKHLAGLSALGELELWGTKVGDAGLAHLARLTELRHLNLGGTKLSDAGLVHLAELRDLEFLSLWGTEVTDAGLARLAGLTALRELELFYTKVGDAGLAYLAGMTELRYLALTGTEISDAGLVHLAGLTALRELDIGSTKITDAGLVHLAGLSGLLELSLGGAKVTDAGLAHLAGLTSLRELVLGGTRVTDAGLAHLAGLTSLRELELGGTGVTDAGLVHLTGLAELQDLGLGGTKISDVGLARLSRFAGLRELELWYTDISDEGLTHLSGLAGLQDLELGGTGITDMGLAHLATLSELRELEIGSTGVTEAGIKNLREALPALEVYELANF